LGAELARNSQRLGALCCPPEHERALFYEVTQKADALDEYLAENRPELAVA